MSKAYREWQVEVIAYPKRKRSLRCYRSIKRQIQACEKNAARRRRNGLFRVGARVISAFI